jgi:hypothetical protein
VLVTRSPVDVRFRGPTRAVRVTPSALVTPRPLALRLALDRPPYDRVVPDPRPVYVTHPPKKISEMTDEERRRYVEEIWGAFRRAEDDDRD